MRGFRPWLAVMLSMAVHGVARGDEAAVPDLQGLAGQTVTVELKGAPILENVEVVKVASNSSGALKSLTIKNEKGRKVTLPATKIVEIFLDKAPLDVTFDKRSKTIAHSPEKRQARLDHEQEVNQRLESKRHRLWPELTAEEHEDWIGKHKEFIGRVQAEFPALNMQLVETKYYLFCTDIPPQRVNIYLAYLDSMYEELCKAFSIPKGKNIWCGKCVVVAFQSPASFAEFENKLMDYNVPSGVQGLHHGESTGRVVISVWKGDLEAYFATTLVHETAHGFIHRYKSTVHIESWVNEGIAEWVAANVVTADKAVSRKQQDAAQRVRQTKSLGGNFFAGDRNIESWQYGVAVSMVDLMLRIDAPKYRQFFDGMKEGLSPAESLQEHYDLTFAQLVARYGATIGVPDAVP
ncbi:MAG: hypothetical protein AB7I37_01240 [Pirellulales bacterium]